MDKFFLSTPIALMNAALLPALGIFATFYYEILQTDQWGWQHFVFWAGVALFIISFSFRQGAANRFQNKLVTRSKDLETAILTMPPEGFMAIYGRVYLETHKIYKTGCETELITKAELEVLIRAVLSGIITLTMKFDKRSENDKGEYHANIMFFCDVYKKDEERKKELEKSMMFQGASLDLDKLQGALYLENKLSTNSKTDQPDVDDTIQSLKLALPVPSDKTSQHSNKIHVLPGAPYAFITGKTSRLNRFSKTSDLYEWMDREGDFNNSIMNEVKEYFKDKKNDVKSFVSIPLLDEEDKTVAVLNIHKTTESLLENDKKLQIYYDTMKPMLIILSELVIRWAQKDKD